MAPLQRMHDRRVSFPDLTSLEESESEHGEGSTSPTPGARTKHDYSGLRIVRAPGRRKKKPKGIVWGNGAGDGGEPMAWQSVDAQPMGIGNPADGRVGDDMPHLDHAESDDDESDDVNHDMPVSPIQNSTVVGAGASSDQPVPAPMNQELPIPKGTSANHGTGTGDNAAAAAITEAMQRLGIRPNLADQPIRPKETEQPAESDGAVIASGDNGGVTLPLDRPLNHVLEPTMADIHSLVGFLEMEGKVRYEENCMLTSLLMWPCLAHVIGSEGTGLPIAGRPMISDRRILTCARIYGR
jgi:hypothetical protein